MSASALIVPIDVRAYASSESDGAQIANARFRYDQLPLVGSGQHDAEPPITSSVEQGGDDTSPMASGIHLHWALPGAMTTVADWSGFLGAAQSIPTLAAPDIWLVVRFNPQTKQDAPLVAFIVESSRLNPRNQNGGGPVPAALPTSLADLTDKSTQMFQYFGQQSGAAGWSLDGDAVVVPALSSVGHGLAHFAGYHPDCNSLFGCFDPCGADVIEPVSYLVVGWYRDPTNDPLYNGGTPRTAGEVLTALNWAVTGAQAADPLPAMTLFAGMISAVDPNAAPPSPDTGISLAVGATPASALSALVASLAAEPAVAPALTALQYSRLDLADQADAAPRIDDLLHDSGFHHVGKGHLTTLVPAGGPPGSGAQPALPDILLAPLLALNQAELEEQALEQQCAALRQQLFLDWQNYISAVYQKQSDLSSIMAALVESSIWGGDQNCLSGSAVLQAAVAALAAKRQDVARQKQTLAELTALDLPFLATYRLDKVNTPRFQRPLDPGFAIYGPALEGPDRIGGSVPNIDAPALPVRLDNQILAGLTIPPGVAGATQSTAVPVAGLPALSSAFPNLGTGGPAALLTALTVEALLIDPLQAALLAGLAQQGVVASDLQALLAANYASDEIAGGGLTYATLDGVSTPALPPALALVAWSGNPWLPVLLQWQLEVAPFQTMEGGAYAADTLTANFSMDSAATELSVQDGAAKAGSYALSNVGVLSSSVSQTLLATVNQAAAQDADLQSELAPVEQVLQANPIHTGTFATLFSQSLQTTSGPQLPPMDVYNYPVSTKTQPFQTFSSTVASLVGGQTRGLSMAPPGAPQPLVNGVVTVTSLVVVDCFGQRLELTMPDNLPTDDLLAVPAAYAKQGGNFYLPPRLAVPARLLAQWMAPLGGQSQADNPTAPAANPLRGWLLPSPLDDGLLLYDGAGVSLAELSAAGGNFSWTPTPGSPLSGGGSSSAAALVAALQPGDPVLTGFVTDLLSLGGTLDGSQLANFIQVMAEIESTITPSGAGLDPAVIALMGRPLAIVQASIAIQLKDGPPADQSSDGFNKYVQAMTALQQNDPAPPRDPMALTGLEIPVLIGDDGRQDDGLYGYFLSGSDGPVFQASLGAGDPLPSAAFAAASPSPVSVPLDGATPNLMTLLVDPAAPVHLACGLLPVAKLAIPTRFYRPAIQAMQYGAVIGPILAPDPAALQQLSTVPPAVAGAGWQWTPAVQADGVPGWGAPLPVTPLDPLQLASGANPWLVEGWLSVALAAAKSTEESQS